MDWWLAQPIADNGGVLTISYAYPNILMSENYNVPGSPYWCMKAFAFLMLPAGHPFWQTPAAARISHPFPQMEEKSAKFAYCSRYAFSAASERLRRPRRTRC